MKTVVDRAREAGILVPYWVPEKFRHEYADHALVHGEESAASHIRKLKKELEARVKDAKAKRLY